MTADGVILKRTTDYTTISSLTGFAWDDVTEIGDKTWWDGGHAARLIVPTGVTKLKVYAGAVYVTQNNSDDAVSAIQKNGTDTLAVMTPANSGYGGGGIALGLRSVSPADYFLYQWQYLTGSAPTLDKDFTFLAAFTPESVVGLVAATLASDTDINGESILSWNTPEYDNLSAHNGGTGFVAPDDAWYAIVSLSASTTAFLSTTTDTTHTLYRNGNEVAKRIGRDSWWAAGGVFMPIHVNPGDVLTIGSDAPESGATLDATYTRVGIEWIGPRVGSAGVVSNRINRLVLLRSP